MTTLERIAAILEDDLGFDARTLQLEDTLEELGVDSLDHIQLIQHIEDAFDIDIPEEQIEDMTTVGKCVSTVEEILTQTSK